MRQPDRENLQVQLLRPRALHLMREKPEAQEDRPQDNLQELLEQHRQKEHV
jgi:hypothetical protein